MIRFLALITTEARFLVEHTQDTPLELMSICSLLNFTSAFLVSMVKQRACVLVFLVLLFCDACKGLEEWGEACKHAQHPEICISSLKALSLDSGDHSPLYLAAVDSAHKAVKELLLTANTLRSNVGSPNPSPHDVRRKAALRDCIELLQDASELITDSRAELRKHRHQTAESQELEDVRTWMSAALTYYTTCIDGLGADQDDNAAKKMLQHGGKVEKSLSNALSFIASLGPKHDLLLQQTPHWVAKSIGNNTILPNITVAKDGSGQFRNITAALAAAPTKSNSRFVVYIKQGTYFESFEVPRIQNLMFLGDGIGKTIITGNKSVQDPNITTFTSATVVIRANGFIAQDITFQNTAGAVNHQAVAVRITADQVSFFRCSFEGYQDTLYAHSLRQFFTQCDIYGTIDYIFGNAAAVFQNCNLYARVPMAKQKNTYTAQGRTDPNQNTGYAFQNCIVDGVDELKQNISRFPTYLGRPWKEYSVTVFLKCYEGSVLNPAGWLEWDGSFALDTLFYGEYFCYGPGGGSASRVNWSTQIYNSTFASQYTAGSLLSGNDWLPQTNLPFSLGL